MVMELVQGGEFFTYLQAREAPLAEEEARFYAACVVLGLEYMHDRGVAWR
jgi:serine/threonine protein kinase